MAPPSEHGHADFMIALARLRPRTSLIFAAALLSLVAACGGGGGGNAAPAATQASASASALPYTTPIKVAFVGASITAGAAGTGRIWSSQTAGWLRSKYPSVEVRDYSLSFTTSQFAAYRIDGDLQGYVPDLVFVEFAVNDLLLDDNARIRYTDALIYKLRQTNPRVVIVYIAAASALDLAARTAGTVPAHIAQIQGVAERDQVHFIDAGAALWRHVTSQGGSIFSYLPDGIHPSDQASDIYFAAVRDDLSAYLPQAAAGPATTAYIGQSGLRTARILPAASAIRRGCTIGDRRAENPYWRFQQALTCSGGEDFMLDFTGTSIGFVYGAGKDTGALDCTIDGSAPQQVILFDSQPVETGLFLYAKLLTGLANASHHLSCRVNAAPPTVNGVASTGTRAVIAGFMVGGEQPVTP